MSTQLHTPTYEQTGTTLGRLGIWIFLASEVAVFGGLIMIYLLLRLGHPEWADYAANTMNLAGAFNTVVLLTSSLTIVLAHQAAASGKYAVAARHMLVTIAFGGVFLVVKAFEYTHEIGAGFTPTTNLFWSCYYLMTALHGLHVIAGMIAIAVVRRGIVRGENPQRAEYVGMYWHLVDIVWIFLFPLLYLSSGG